MCRPGYALFSWKGASIPDPALEAANDRASYPAFERTATELETRIRFLLHLLDQASTIRRSTHAER
jgi:hypothetical protein